MKTDFASLEARDFAETSEEREEREWREAAEEAGYRGQWHEYRDYLDRQERETEYADRMMDEMKDEPRRLDFARLESGFDGVPTGIEKQFTNQGNV